MKFHLKFIGSDESKTLEPFKEYDILFVPRKIVVTQDADFSIAYNPKVYVFYVSEDNAESYPIRIEYYSAETIAADWDIAIGALEGYGITDKENDNAAYHEARLQRLNRWMLDNPVKVALFGFKDDQSIIDSQYRRCVSRGYIVYAPHFTEYSIFSGVYPEDKYHDKAKYAFYDYMRRITASVNYAIVCSKTGRNIGNSYIDDIISYSSEALGRTWVGFPEDIAFYDSNVDNMQYFNMEFDKQTIPRVIRKSKVN